MRFKRFHTGLAIAAIIGSCLVVAASNASAAQIGHDHFVSDPYADNWCGIDGTSVDTVIANYTLDGSRTSLNVKTIFTATLSGKSMEIQQTGLRASSAPTDNGDGTYSVTFTNAGQSPGIKLPTGEVLRATGLVVGVATFDAATDEFLGFEIVKVDGPRAAACDAIASALS